MLSKTRMRQKETDAIHLTELVKLKQKFDAAELQALDEETFIHVLKDVLPDSITERQLFHLPYLPPSPST